MVEGFSFDVVALVGAAIAAIAVIVQYRTSAAVAKRREARQHACTLWHKLRFADGHKEIGDMVLVCQDWRINNCLYLSPSKREAFHTAIQSKLLHAELLRIDGKPEQLRVARQDFMDAGKLLGVS